MEHENEAFMNLLQSMERFKDRVSKMKYECGVLAVSTMKEYEIRVKTWTGSEDQIKDEV